MHTSNELFEKYLKDLNGNNHDFSIFLRAFKIEIVNNNLYRSWLYLQEFLRKFTEASKNSRVVIVSLVCFCRAKYFKVNGAR